MVFARKAGGVGGDGGLPAIRPAAHPLRGRSRRGRAMCGTARRLEVTEGTRNASRIPSPRAPRTRPAKIGEVRAVRQKSGAGGSRAKPRECGPLTEATFRLPQAAKASAPPARGFAADLGVGRERAARAIVDLATAFSGATGGLGDGFSGGSSGPGDGFFEGLADGVRPWFWLALALPPAQGRGAVCAPNIYVSNNM